MPWVRLSDDWYDDPELIEAGPWSMLLWPLLISWSARNLSDGKIPAGQIRRLVDWSQLGAEPEQAIAPLVATGRLQEIACGYLIVNYHRYQPTREKVLDDREKDRQRKADSRSAARPSGVQTESGDRPALPVHGPVPDNPSSSSRENLNTPALPDGLWKKIAEKKAQTATTPIHDRRAWLKTTAKNAETDDGDRARALVAEYDLTMSQLVDVLVAGTNPAWLGSLRRKVSA